LSEIVRLGIQGVRVSTFIGWREEERRILRPLLVDVELQVEYDGSGELAGTVDLEAVLRVVQNLEGKEFRLLEDLAAQVASGVLSLSPRVRAARVRVSKPLPPVAAHLDCEWAEVTRSRDGEGLSGAGGKRPT